MTFGSYECENMESQVATSRGRSHCLNMLVKEFFKQFYNKQRGKYKCCMQTQIKNSLKILTGIRIINTK
jgi:hypothetical protein